MTALIGLGPEPVRFDLVLKQPPLPWLYVGAIFLAILLFEVLPYLEELVRGLRAHGGHLTPHDTRPASPNHPAAIVGARPTRGS